MLSLTPLSTIEDQRRTLAAALDLYLGRAEQESIAVVRASDDRAAASHCTMAAHYSAKAVALLVALGGEGEVVADPSDWRPRLVAAG